MSAHQTQWFTIHIYWIPTTTQPSRKDSGLFHFLIIKWWKENKAIWAELKGLSGEPNTFSLKPPDHQPSSPQMILLHFLCILLEFSGHIQMYIPWYIFHSKISYLSKISQISFSVRVYWSTSQPQYFYFTLEEMGAQEMKKHAFIELECWLV